MKTSQSIVIERLQQAQNEHDLEAVLACFVPHIQSDRPVHPERAFSCNWSCSQSVKALLAREAKC